MDFALSCNARISSDAHTFDIDASTMPIKVDVSQTPMSKSGLAAPVPTELLNDSRAAEDALLDAFEHQCLSNLKNPVQSNLAKGRLHTDCEVAFHAMDDDVAFHEQTTQKPHDSGAAGVFDECKSKAAKEINDAVEYLNQNPDAKIKVAAVLSKLSAQHFPRPTFVQQAREDNNSQSQQIDNNPDSTLVDGEPIMRSHTNGTYVPSYHFTSECFWRSVVSKITQMPSEKYHPDAPFWTVDLSRVVVQYAKFCKELPTVQPFYAMKCNPCPSMLSMISALGGHYDCASIKEIETVIENGHVAPEHIAERIIFANPCKMPVHMRKAEELGVRMTTFDNEDEVYKLARYMPRAEAVLRIATDDSAAVCRFSTKFGAPMGDVPTLIRIAKENGVKIVGVSFHVGSGNSDPSAYLSAIKNARKVFDIAEEAGFDMKLLDIGGGWPGSEPLLNASTHKPTELSFAEICSHIRPVLDKLFPDTRIIAEPGRYFAHSTQTLAMSVHARRRVRVADASNNGTTDEFQYYVGDGLYHSFNSILYDFQKPNLQVLRPDREAAIRPITTIFGPTCDSLDCVMKCQPFPDLELGEWLFVPDFGAYTSAGGCAFNGYSTDRIEYIWSMPDMPNMATPPSSAASSAGDESESEDNSNKFF